jgi:hypothetical protein
MAQDDLQLTDNNWISFPGGELDGQRPSALCPACRDALNRAVGAERSRWPIGRSRASRARTLCFQCYRADLERNRSLSAAGQLNTASNERFQGQLPFESVDASRLQMLKAERVQARVLAATGPGGPGRPGRPGRFDEFADRRRRAQIAARHALQSVATGCRDRHSGPLQLPDRARAITAAIHAAELQLPESWLPFVVSR